MFWGAVVFQDKKVELPRNSKGRMVPCYQVSWL